MRISPEGAPDAGLVRPLVLSSFLAPSPSRRGLPRPGCTVKCTRRNCPFGSRRCGAHYEIRMVTFGLTLASGLPVICPNRTSPSTLSVIALLTSLFCEGRTRLLQARYLAPWMETSDSYVVEHRCGDAAAEFPFDVQVNRLHAISRRAWKCGLNFVNRLCNIMAA